MTGYQKLKIENEILWSKIETYLIYMFKDYEDQDELVAKELDDMSWEIKRAQYEKKNRD